MGKKKKNGGREVLRGGRLSVDRNRRPGICWGPVTEEKESKEDLGEADET